MRDLVRARDDARADLMRVRHRLSKLLLRQGIVYSGGTPWTCVHESWLRKQRFADRHLKAAFDHSFDAVLAAKTARNRLDEQILDVAASARFADAVNRLGCLRGISALTGLALTWRSVTGRGSRLLDRRLRRAGAQRVLLGHLTGARIDHQGRQHPCAATAHRGGLASPQVLQHSGRACGRGGPRWTPRCAPRSRRQPAPLRQVAGLHRAEEEPLGGQRCGRARVVGLVLVAGHDVKRQP